MRSALIAGTRIVLAGMLLQSACSPRSACKPHEVEVFSEHQNYVTQIVSDGSLVCWINSLPRGWVACKPTGGRSVSILASDQSTPSSVAMDSEFVYWSNQADGYWKRNGSLWRVPRGGGQAKALAHGLQCPTGVVVDDESVYWSEVETVKRVAKGGGESTVIVSGISQCFYLCVDGTFVYCSSTDVLRDEVRILRVPKSGGDPILLATVSGRSPELALGKGLLFFAGDGGIWSVPVGGGQAGLAVPTPKGEITREQIASSQGSLYFAYQGSIWVFPTEGGAPRKLMSLRKDGGSIAGLTVDANHVYWGENAPGRIMRMKR